MNSEIPSLLTAPCDTALHFVYRYIYNYILYFYNAEHNMLLGRTTVGVSISIEHTVTNTDDPVTHKSSYVDRRQK